MIRKIILKDAMEINAYPLFFLNPIDKSLLEIHVRLILTMKNSIYIFGSEIIFI